MFAVGVGFSMFLSSLVLLPVSLSDTSRFFGDRTPFASFFSIQIDMASFSKLFNSRVCMFLDPVAVDAPQARPI